jgi:excisionase family DNA binding protein
MTSDESLLTITDVARILNISRAQAYMTIRERGFPLIELGERMLRVKPTQLEKWIEQKVN